MCLATVIHLFGVDNCFLTAVGKLDSRLNWDRTDTTGTTRQARHDRHDTTQADDTLLSFSEAVLDPSLPPLFGDPKIPASSQQPAASSQQPAASSQQPPTLPSCHTGDAQLPDGLGTLPTSTAGRAEVVPVVGCYVFGRTSGRVRAWEDALFIA
ncbi:hypothetical protein E2P81_ATG04652 [Venturia nashicola]|nr:hypothetical protein E2P81_ATG04652 [Venturia nashicola]